jgi:hypothetical protein
MSSIANLKQYDIVLTSSFEFKFGISGHLFEMIDYYWAIKNYTNLTPCILLADGVTIDEFNNAVKQKYDDLTIEHVEYCVQPKVIIAKNLLIVDGSPQLKNANLFVDNIFLFRCSASNFEVFDQKRSRVFLLQDFEVYPERYEDSGLMVIDYKKKILFSKYKKYNSNINNTAMFYLTTICRALPQDELISIIDKYQFENNLILTDDPSVYTLDNVYKVPLEDIWDKFDTYIYTSIPRKNDCSSRFILECMHYKKEIIYEIDYYDKALEIRKKDGLSGTSLLPDDTFLQLLNEQIKH